MVEYTPVEYEAVEYEEEQYVTIDYEEFTRLVHIAFLKVSTKIESKTDAM